jgi:hypothetical protein
MLSKVSTASDSPVDSFREAMLLPNLIVIRDRIAMCHCVLLSGLPQAKPPGRIPQISQNQGPLVSWNHLVRSRPEVHRLAPFVPI